MMGDEADHDSAKDDFERGYDAGAPIPRPRFKSDESGWTWCEDCGCAIVDRNAHRRFHATLDRQAAAIARLLTAHLSESIHDRWDINERLRQDRWKDAL